MGLYPQLRTLLRVKGAGLRTLSLWHSYCRTTIAPMIRRPFATLLLSCVLFSPILVCAKSQMMSPQQYADFINKLDAAASSWQERIKRLEGINLPLDADKRQQLSAKGALAIAILNQTKSKVLAEREHPSLALEITLLGTLESASGLLMQLITDVADSGGKKPWVDAVTAIQDDIAAYAGPLQRHVMSKADDMEYRLEDCEAQSKNRHQ